MTPHERKDNPPRREHGSGEADTGETAGEVYEETHSGQSAGDYPEDVSYDPGAALVDENLSYGSPDPAFYEPHQAYAETEEQAYYPTEAGYAESDSSLYSPAAGDSGVYDESPVHVPPLVPPRSTRAAAPKKKVPHRAPQRRPATSPVRRAPVKPVYGEGISFMTVLLFLVALAMLAVVVMVVLPKDMATVSGYPNNPLAAGKPRNLLAEAQALMIDRTKEIAFTEEEVNQYLNHRLGGEQKGPMAALVKFRGVYVDFTSGGAEVVIEREIFGMPMTMSVNIVPEEFRRQVIYKPSAWNIGKVSLGARTVKPVVDLFSRLRGSLIDEYHALQQMSGVRFEDNRVVLDARI